MGKLNLMRRLSSQVKPAAHDSEFGNFRMSQSISESILSVNCSLLGLITFSSQYISPHFSGGQTLEMNLVTVYDIHNKFIAYSAPIPEVKDVLSEWGSLYVLAGDHRVSIHGYVLKLPPV